MLLTLSGASTCVSAVMLHLSFALDIQGALVKKAWSTQREFLVMAGKCKKPDQAGLMDKLKPVQAITKV